MVTLKQIRDDLKEIRHYYSRKEIFDTGNRIVGASGIVEKAERYNNAVKNAPCRLYDLYISLYLQNRTQDAFAEEFGYSPEYVYQMNKKLVLFLQKQFKEN